MNLKFKDILNENVKTLLESSLSRLWSHNTAHECGAMTAFRKYKDPIEKTILYTRSENKARNLSLSSKLKSLGYNITKIIGNYPEGGKQVKEISYFIVDVNDKGKLKKDLISLGKEFEQDSILFVPKGAIDNSGKEKAYLYRTNNYKGNWMFDNGVQKELFSKGKIGFTSPIYTSYIHGRPFIFENCTLEEIEFGSGFGAMYVHKISKKNWKELI
jgi:hypothetical protein